MRFDRTAPGGGVEAGCRLENGKAILDWEFHLVQCGDQQERKIPVPQSNEEDRTLLQKEKGYIRLFVTDRQNIIVLECVQKLCEEEPLQSILLQPELWSGARNPCLYGMEAVLIDGMGAVRDRVQGQLPLRCLRCGEREGKSEIFLNDERLEPKAVRYILPDTGTAAAIQRQMLEDLEWMRKLGANCVCIEDSGNANLFLQLCDRCGILVFQKEKKQQGYVWAHGCRTGRWLPSEAEIPSFRGGGDSLFLPGCSCPAPLFYQFQAKWNDTPFVHIVPESVQRLASGNYTAICYSNCDRVALYSDGILFEFKSGEGEFLFREIPAKTPSIMLTAEGEGCSHSLSLHKSFTK